MSNGDDLKEKQQKLDEIKEIMSQFQEKLNSTTRELNKTKEKLASTTTELEEAKEPPNAKLEKLKTEINDSITKNSELEKELHDAKANITELNKKIKDLEDSLFRKEVEIKKLKEIIGEKDKTHSQKVTQKEQIKKEIHMPKPQEIKVEYKSEERKTCPNCGAVGHDIKTFENRDKILDYLDHKTLYAKKNICRKCGHEF